VTVKRTRRSVNAHAAISEFVAWYCSEPRLAFNRTVVLRYRIHLEQRHYAPATINLRPAAVRRVAYEADVVGKVDTSVLFRCRPGFKAAIDTWTMAAGITHGAVFRAISKTCCRSLKTDQEHAVLLTEN